MTDVRIGVSGWNYDDWRGEFYPQGLAKRRWLEYASRQFNSIEHNGAFYRLQKPESYRRWAKETPPGFRFALKGPRFITGVKRLKDPRAPLVNFFASGPLELESKLGPVLWQLPGSFPCDLERLEAFLDLLPRDTEQARRLAANFDGNLKTEPAYGSGQRRRIRHAMEFRSESWFTDECLGLLKARGVALVFSDSPGKWPYCEDVTADFVYLRLHGSDRLYRSNYGDAALRDWAERLRRWTRGEQPGDSKTATSLAPPKRKRRDAYVYFDNTDEGHAPLNAAALARLVE